MTESDAKTSHDGQHSARLQAYLDLFAQLQPADLGRFADYFAKDARFKDPFNDVRGVEAIQRIFAHMFASVTEPVFQIQSAMERGDQAMIHWHFSCQLRNQSRYAIDGLSLVRFDAAGLVVEHVDYWDAAEQFYMRLPIIGSLLRLIARKLRA